MRAGIAAALVVGIVGACGSNTTTSGNSGRLAVTHKLDRTCVPIGEKQTLLATTEPNVNIAFVPQYKDRLIHGEAPKGYTDNQGIFKRSWIIPEDAPTGTADLRIIAAKGRKTAIVVLTFDVVPEGESCT